jgi:hypothetical protein
MLFKEIVAGHFENDAKRVNALCGQSAKLLILKAVLNRVEIY